MFRIVRKRALLGCVALLFCPPLFGQSAIPATPPTTFHITGAITGPGNDHAFAVTFEGPSSKTVMTNKAGAYEANLPLGLWTITVFGRGSDGKIFTNMVYFRRPPFRVTVPTSMVFDISLPQGTLCTIMVVGRDGGPPTQEEEDHVKAWCAGEEFFSVPSASVPFEVHLWGGMNFAGCDLPGCEKTLACKRAFATYNTLSVQAD